MAKIILAGFDAETAEKLSQKLVNLHHQTELFLGDLRYLAARRPDLVFLSGDDVRRQGGLASLKSKAADTPVIVASRAVDDSLWLAALEAGATDYCSVDVDPANLDWMLKNALETRVFAGAA
jgi:DNA-binding NarL/FixJ family response regulator